jgi:hypothetical protein
MVDWYVSRAYLGIVGAMRLEAKKFRPRLVVKRVLQLAVASVQNKNLNLSGDVADEVPEEVRLNGDQTQGLRPVISYIMF